MDLRNACRCRVTGVRVFSKHSQALRKEKGERERETEGEKPVMTTSPHGKDGERGVTNENHAVGQSLGLCQKFTPYSRWRKLEPALTHSQAEPSHLIRLNKPYPKSSHNCNRQLRDKTSHQHVSQKLARLNGFWQLILHGLFPSFVS
ncbi:uncharacterized [Tachysurus ichikawai]